MICRRDFLTLLGSAAVAWPVVASRSEGKKAPTEIGAKCGKAVMAPRKSERCVDPRHSPIKNGNDGTHCPAAGQDLHANQLRQLESGSCDGSIEGCASAPIIVPLTTASLMMR
jgi:hypothetical protein